MKRSKAVPADTGLLVCLAGSGGGHLRQLFDLEPVWRDWRHFFVTEDTPLGRSHASVEDTEFVPHFALGQARLGHPFRMIAGALRGIRESWRAVRRRRPDVVITTGAGSMLFTSLFARLSGAKVILIDSFARFEKPSKFARLVGPLAHVRISQSETAAKVWGTPMVFDPFRFEDDPRPAKEPLLFATVGATLPFERLSRLVLDAKRSGAITEEVILQVGEGVSAQFEPVPGVRLVETLPFEEIKQILARADIVVCHGGTGSLITALREKCRVIAIPREVRRGEHYDNHQEEITNAFVARGLIATAGNDADFAAALQQVRAFEPRGATLKPDALIAALQKILEQWAIERTTR